MATSFAEDNRRAYRFAVRDRRVQKQCAVCAVTIGSTRDDYMTFASVEGDPKNLFCCGQKSCMAEMARRFEPDDAEFRIPLTTPMIDTITQQKRSVGRLAIIGAIVATLAALPLAILAFVGGGTLFGSATRTVIALIWICGHPLFRDAFLPL